MAPSTLEGGKAWLEEAAWAGWSERKSTHFQKLPHMAIVFCTVSSCLMYSIVASRALVPRVASSSTALTVFKSDVTFVTITWREKMTKTSDSFLPFFKGSRVCRKPN